MCGIAGIIGIGPEEGHRRVCEMIAELERRGPDDVGIETWPDAVLGHRRLSVFDLTEAGHQPMMSRSGKTAIVFNGAIYNFRKLRKTLEAKGSAFVSNSDTEVLLEGYRVWGIEELLRRIDGMFAFAIWDARKETLFLVRDRLGVKPLVYAGNGGQFAFASTVRALKNGGFCDGLSKKGLIEYLEFGFVTDSNSIYEGVKKVPPASIVTVNRRSVSVKSYWNLPEERGGQMDFEEAVEESERLILESVEKRLFADVPVGALLSGGIDSSLVCWAAATLGGDVTAFTVGVPGDEWDETDIAAKTARSLGIEHRTIRMTGHKPYDLSVLSTAYSEPFACASALGLLDISREVKKHATVLLTGDGGDDVFLGYPEHLHFHLAGSLAKTTPEAVGKLVRELSGRIPGSGRIKRARSFLSYAFGGLGGVTRARDGIPVYRDAGLLGESLADADFPDRSLPMNHGSDLLAEFLRYDMRTRFTGEYLTKVDGGTMYHALEARSPFLDYKMWEFASSLPFAVRLRGRELKAVLREIVRRRIGPELASAEKKGFGVPVQRWLTDEWNGRFRDSMEDSRIEKHGYIDAGAALKMLDDAEESGWAPRQLWFVLVLENWLRHEGI